MAGSVTRTCGVALAAGAFVEEAVSVEEAFGVVFGGVGEFRQDGAGVGWGREDGCGCEEDREEKFGEGHAVVFGSGKKVRDEGA